jgi:hypothetical protein
LPIFTFHYTLVHRRPTPAFPKGKLSAKPFVQVEILSPHGNLSCRAIIDSGAEHCVFPRSFLPQLGLDPLEAPVEFSSGLGSLNVPTHLFDINLNFAGIVTFPMRAGFTVGMDNHGFGLLGQTGFFDRFHVRFKLDEGIFEVEVP